MSAPGGRLIEAPPRTIGRLLFAALNRSAFIECMRSITGMKQLFRIQGEIAETRAG